MGHAGGEIRAPLIARSFGVLHFFPRGNFMASLMLDTPRALNDLVGREVAVTDWFSLSQDRVRGFAEATEDRQWIHVDPERAQKESPYGATIAHGFLTLSLLSHFLREAIQFQSGVKMGINYGLNRVRFPSPVRVDSQIRARVSVQSTKELANIIQATFSIAVECRETSKPCCVADWIVRYYTE